MDNAKDNGDALLASEEKYRLLTSLMPVGVFYTDQAGIITSYNEKAAELWGRSPRLKDPAEVRFCGALKLYDADGIPLAHEDCPMSQALQYKKKLRSQEVCLEQPHGKRIAVLENIDPIFDREGQLTGAINVFQDITERKQTQASTIKLAAIVESSEDAIISKTLTGIITSWNKAAEIIFGYQQAEIIGNSINILIPLSHRDEENNILQKIRKGEKVEHFETIRLHKTGREINISLTVSPVKNEKGQIVGASKISRDITEKVKKDNQLKVYAEKLKQLNKHKDDFMAMASHELKTPLTVIKANIELLQLKLNDNSSREFVARTIIQINKLSGIVSDLLSITSVQTGNLKLNLHTFDLKTMLIEIAEEIQQSNSTHKIIIQTFGDNVPITADPIRLEQVIINLLTNGIKYSPASDKVIVVADYQKDQVIISIRDFGIGIAQEHIKKVFTRFFHVKGALSKSLGSGIGLYISKKIIKRHKGKIWVDSEKDKGSTFYFIIPTVQ